MARAAVKAKQQAKAKAHPSKAARKRGRRGHSGGDNACAVTALQSYLALKQKDADVWAELGSLELTQAQTAGTQYQAAQQASQLADPSAAFLPGGTLAQAVGTNAAYQNAAQQASA